MLNVLYVDMNSYFASVEQQLRPELRGRPVAVVPVEADTTSCIAASYEAKAFGVRTGTRVGDARVMCPGLVLVKARTDEYIKMHHAMQAAIDCVLPVATVHSIDEVSCRLLGTQRQPEVALQLARAVKEAMRTRIGTAMRCSIGIAGNRLLAKIAADMHKPDGLTMLRNEELMERLSELKLTDLPGVGARMELRLRQAGIGSMAELLALDAQGMRRAFGSVLGIEMYYRLRGADSNERATVRRSIGHSHVLSPKRRHEEGARAVAVRLVTKLGTRARHLGYMAGRMTLSIRLWHTLGVRAPRTGAPTRGERWGGRGSGDQWWETDEVIDSTNDTMTLVRALATMWDRKPPGGALKIGVTLTDLTPAAGATGMLFGRPERKYSIEGGRRLSKAMDRIAKKFGADAVYPGSMHDAKSSAPRRIAFGSIPDLDVPDVVESGEQDE